ncbi:hypothetical protein PF005_g16629 [Phytophthora fragariae]|uniref:Uncharacterized protein n=1 Tax=Phytophthora fragariae TaxID=53985 RepID=A0A6A3RGE8_9STRA|nr:hypothetical protein PF003_g37414 [Phytophthora fragariae]KAE8936166.1 hypothetical protein PF009_g13906 [Phytophthora fragariae]KAE8999962.1 hypothetical protein PF011_g14400 [Phytophthora fragariae]KAE9096721.1 hypothetical protein PF007_g16889 [Phytophthora fragariae]KAE9096793.1 hypothetical protein PF010_g16201 [Phytophthora fragariae]
MQQPESSRAHGSSTSTGAPTPRLRFFFLALVSLSIVSVLVVSSRIGDSSTRLKSPHNLQVVSPLKEHNWTRDNATEQQQRVSSIPRVIHQSWKSVDRIPTRFHPWMRSWRDLHPTWSYVFWTDEDNLLLFQRLYPQYLHIARAVKKVSLADMARVSIRDNELFLSSEPLVHTVLLEKSSSAALCNALMASAPGYPFWLQVLDNIKAKFDHERLKSDAVELTGPRMLKQTYEALNSTFNADIVVFPSEFFYPEVAYWNMEPMQEACRRRHDDEAREA